MLAETKSLTPWGHRPARVFGMLREARCIPASLRRRPPVNPPSLLLHDMAIWMADRARPATLDVPLASRVLSINNKSEASSSRFCLFFFFLEASRKSRQGGGRDIGSEAYCSRCWDAGGGSAKPDVACCCVSLPREPVLLEKVKPGATPIPSFRLLRNVDHDVAPCHRGTDE